MYGKHFESMYEGSMYGAGLDVFAVWGYVIAHTKQSRVELNPKKLSDTLGGTMEAIEKAVDFLMSPDPGSRHPEHEGRRLLKEGQFQYFVPSWDDYQAIKNAADRREYNRLKKQESRMKLIKPIKENTSSRPRFQPPTHSDLTSAGLSPLEAEKFIDHYDSCGWKVGKKPMKDWEAAVRGWKRRAGEFSNGNAEKPSSEMTDEEILKYAMQ